MPKKEFDTDPTTGESLDKKDTNLVMLPIPRDVEIVNGMHFVTREQALNMVITMLLSVK